MPSKLMRRLSPGEFHRAAEGAQRDPTTMARATVYFFTAGATLGVVDILVRTGGEASLAGQVVSTAAAYAIAAYVLVVFDRLPPWVYGALIALGTVLITAGVYFGDAGVSALVLLYCWVALYAGHFHRRPWAVLQLGIIGVAYGVALAARGGGPMSILHWVVAMGTLAVVAAVVGSLRHRLEGLVVRLGETARTDALTGLLNRRGFLERLETQLESARRGESPPSLVFGDFDGFKRLPRSLRPRGGRRGAQAYRRDLRACHASHRRGRAHRRRGVRPDRPRLRRHERAPTGGAAEGRARRGVRREAVPLTMSFGIATFPLDGEDPGELMRSVDRALYGAKADRGDCSVVCSDQRGRS